MFNVFNIFKKGKPAEMELSSSSGPTGPDDANTFGQQRDKDQPRGLNSIFRRIQDFYKSSTFLSAYIPSKVAFYNYGFSITTVDDTAEQQAKLEKWLSFPFISKVVYTDLVTQETLPIELNVTTGEAIRNFARNVWEEFLLFDNCVPMWQDNGTVPVLLELDRCFFVDKLGSPILRYTHGLTPLDYQLIGQDQVQRFLMRTDVLINPTFGEHFKVMKRAPVGAGFGTPRLNSLLSTLGEIQSKEAGFYGQSWNLRAAVRQHKLGHEITQGPHAGKPTHFWTKKWADAVIAQWRGRQGQADMTNRFDHEITYPWPDPKSFDETAWKGTDRRLRNWGGPLAQLLVSDTIVEGGFSSMRWEVANDRQMVKDLLTTVVSAAFNPPPDLKWQIVWSDLCFIEPSKFVEIFKFSAMQGISSIKTTREMIGLNSAKEDARKMAEALDPDAMGKYLPMWDTSHGIAPALGQTAVALHPAKAPTAGKGPDGKPVAAPAAPEPNEPNPPTGTAPTDGLVGDQGGTGRTAPAYTVQPGATGPVGPGITGIHFTAPMPPAVDPKDAGYLNPPPTGAPVGAPPAKDATKPIL